MLSDSIIKIMPNPVASRSSKQNAKWRLKAPRWSSVACLSLCWDVLHGLHLQREGTCAGFLAETMVEYQWSLSNAIGFFMKNVVGVFRMAPWNFLVCCLLWGYRICTSESVMLRILVLFQFYSMIPLSPSLLWVIITLGNQLASWNLLKSPEDPTCSTLGFLLQIFPWLGGNILTY